jgi:hypothetical protein
MHPAQEILRSGISHLDEGAQVACATTHAANPGVEGAQNDAKRGLWRTRKDTETATLLAKPTNMTQARHTPTRIVHSSRLGGTRVGEKYALTTQVTTISRTGGLAMSQGFQVLRGMRYRRIRLGFMRSHRSLLPSGSMGKAEGLASKNSMGGIERGGRRLLPPLLCPTGRCPAGPPIRASRRGSRRGPPRRVSPRSRSRGH